MLLTLHRRATHRHVFCTNMICTLLIDTLQAYAACGHCVQTCYAQTCCSQPHYTYADYTQMHYLQTCYTRTLHRHITQTYNTDTTQTIYTHTCCSQIQSAHSAHRLITQTCLYFVMKFFVSSVVCVCVIGVQMSCLATGTIDLASMATYAVKMFHGCIQCAEWNALDIQVFPLISLSMLLI